MKKIDGHLHLVRSLAGLSAEGRMTPLGNGKAIWDNGMFLNLIPEGWGDHDFTAESALKVMEDNEVEKAVLLKAVYMASRTITLIKQQRNILINLLQLFLLTHLLMMRWKSLDVM